MCTIQTIIGLNQLNIQTWSDFSKFVPFFNLIISPLVIRQVKLTLLDSLLQGRYYDMILSTKLAGFGHAAFLFMTTARDRVSYIYPNVNSAGAGLLLSETFTAENTNLSESGYKMWVFFFLSQSHFYKLTSQNADFWEMWNWVLMVSGIIRWRIG